MNQLRKSHSIVFHDTVPRLRYCTGLGADISGQPRSHLCTGDIPVD